MLVQQALLLIPAFRTRVLGIAEDQWPPPIERVIQSARDRRSELRLVAYFKPSRTARLADGTGMFYSLMRSWTRTFLRLSALAEGRRHSPDALVSLGSGGGSGAGRAGSNAGRYVTWHGLRQPGVPDPPKPDDKRASTSPAAASLQSQPRRPGNDYETALSLVNEYTPTSAFQSPTAAATAAAAAAARNPTNATLRLHRSPSKRK
jgi:hypothetical protein